MFRRRQFSADTITELSDPSGFGSDPFTDVLRDGARKLIEQAIHAELAALMAAFSEVTLEDGGARLVRHGHLPEREVMTGIGPVPVKVPRVRDRGAGEDRITFTPSILPRDLRKAKSVEELLPWHAPLSLGPMARQGAFSRVCPRAISPRRWRPCWGRTPKACLRRPSRG